VKALVTGAAGFIASHLTDELVRRGWEVIAVDSMAGGQRANVNPMVEFVEADVRQRGRFAELLKDVDLVLHHGGLATVPGCSDDPLLAFDVNVQGTICLAESVRTASPGATFVFASSAAVYGPHKEPTLCTEEDVPAPSSVYGASKLAAEAGLLALRASFGLDVRIVRYANVYGPRQPRYIMYDMYHKIRKSNGRVAVLGSGKQLRDFIFVDDAVAVTLAVASQSANDERKPIYNVGTGVSTSVLDIAAHVARAMGRSDVRFETTQSSWIGDIDYLLLDPNRTRECISAAVPVEEGIRRFIAWIGTQPESSP
jgi:UDP-glucose 4-epimerase